MSNYNGKMGKGTQKVLKAERRMEAERRSAAATKRDCGHRHNDTGAAECAAVTTFGNPYDPALRGDK